jgi:hypothetical protein
VRGGQFHNRGPVLNRASSYGGWRGQRSARVERRHGVVLAHAPKIVRVSWANLVLVAVDLAGRPSVPRENRNR